MKMRYAVAAALLLSFAAPLALAAEKEDEQPSFWMQKKLEYSGEILEALAKSARSMSALTQMERWVRSSLPEYRSQLRIFTNANEQLIRAADDHQLDAAALAYVQLTLSCVNCHKVVRDSTAESASRNR
jgi:hypothetical protein